jgi:hypothetical protein
VDAKEEPGVLALLAAVAGALYLLTWLTAGPPVYRALPAIDLVPSIAPSAIALAKMPG